MERRTFIGTLAGGLLAAPLAAEAQPSSRVARVGTLSVEAGSLDDVGGLRSSRRSRISAGSRVRISSLKPGTQRANPIGSPRWLRNSSASKST
jgi:hypothetical protein